MPASAAGRRPLAAFAWLSIATALVTIAMKGLAYWLTGSVGLLSDALESLVNLAAAIVALSMIRVAARPPDEDHAYGYSKAEYFASGFEGALIMVAALTIAVAAVQRLLAPVPLEQLDVGLAVSALAALLNLAVGRVLIRAGKRHDSIALEADGHHLLTDVWTSGGIILGLLAVLATGWHWLDPVIAIGVALNILREGWSLVRRSVDGLMDRALEPAARTQIDQVLEEFRHQAIRFDHVSTRRAGQRRFVDV
ncbi:MAG: cation transporter, partial [Burkholderiales bacterium]|nr:cation transporter [Burkholderiales bacterium]